MSDSLQSHGLCSPWNSPGQNTGVGSLSLLQQILPTQESKRGLLHCRWILYQLSYKGSLGCLLAAAAAASSLQSCPTLCDPTECSPPGFPVPGILQARTLEWVAISFSNVWKWKWNWSHSVVSDSLRPCGLQLTRLLRPWDFPGKGTGVACHCLLQRCLLTIVVIPFACLLLWRLFLWIPNTLCLLFSPLFQ